MDIRLRGRAWAYAVVVPVVNPGHTHGRENEESDIQYNAASSEHTLRKLRPSDPGPNSTLDVWTPASI